MATVEDPLEAYNGLSLFSRSLSSLPNPLPHESASIHDFLKSLPVRNTDKLVKEAKSILESREQVTNTATANDLTSEKENEDPGQQIAQNPRGRRPGLVRKRARFSMVSSSNQPSVNLEPTLDIDNLKDPVDFFQAVERLEHAKKEIAKQTGNVSSNSNPCSTSIVPRPRRPGLQGRSRTVQYKHLYPTAPSQETLDEDTLTQTHIGSQQDTSYPDIATPETEITHIVSEQREESKLLSEEAEVAGSMKKIDKLLDKLLSQDELDGDGALDLLQNQLNIKPLDIEKLNLPEIPDIRRIDLRSPGSLSKRRNVSADKENYLTTMSKTTPKQRDAQSPVYSFGSPTPPKCPFSSLSLLRKSISQSDPLNDPYSAADIDKFPSIDVSVGSVGKNHEAALLVKDSISGNQKLSITGKDDQRINPMSTSKEATTDFTATSEKFISESSTSIPPDDSGRRNSCFQSEDENVSGNNLYTNEDLTHRDTYMDDMVNETNRLEDTMEDVMHGTVLSEEPDLNVDTVALESTKNTRNENVVADPAVVETQESAAKRLKRSAREGTQDVAPKPTQDITVEQHFEQQCEAAVNEQKKAGLCTSKQHKKKLHLGRHSLAAASGTSWNDGVRRSTRIRSRPLEYWKGERFLYGRIHGSLATVIGIKYESPAKDSNNRPTMKVKSFVSDEYKDLVELAALH